MISLYSSVAHHSDSISTEKVALDPSQVHPLGPSKSQPVPNSTLETSIGMVTQVTTAPAPDAGTFEDPLQPSSDELQYQNAPNVIAPQNSAVSAFEVIIGVIIIGAILSFLGSLLRCLQLKRK